MKTVIIIVTYNGMEWYQRCFDSLRTSTIPLDVIVIDNASSDQTTNYIKSNYPEIHLVESSSNLGFGKANNIGFEYALKKNADYIYLLNQDAWIKPDTLEKLVLQMKKNKEYGILSPIHLNGAENRLDANHAVHLSPNMCPELIDDCLIKGKALDKVYKLDFINAAHWLISKECLKTVGGFNPLFYHYGEDANYVNRIKYHNFSIGVYPFVFAIHDRDFSIRVEDTFKKLLNKETISLFIHCADIQRSLPQCFRTCFVLYSKRFTENIIYFQFKKAMVNFCAFGKLIFNLEKINKYRNLSKNKGLNFLSDTNLYL